MMMKAHRLAVRIIAALYGTILAAGLIGFLATTSASVTDPVGAPPAKNLAADVNLAHFRSASWIRASSYAWLYIHHPLFVIDGVAAPRDAKEQWVPDRRTDEKPWIEVHLGRKADLSSVTVFHDARYSERFYTVSCLGGGRTIKTMTALQTAETRVTFPLACKGADTVRLDFTWDPYSPTGHIRICEIEVWGR